MFINNKEDIKHAYEKYVTLANKPVFDIVYDLVLIFVQGFIENKDNIIWSYETLKWEDIK